MFEQNPEDPSYQTKAAFESGRLVCLNCLRKHRLPLTYRGPLHYATCTVCRSKTSVAQQQRH